jgi:hypothetical protein
LFRTRALSKSFPDYNTDDNDGSEQKRPSIYSAVFNALNSRIVTISGTVSTRCIRLWNVASGALLWSKEQPLTDGRNQLAEPSFSEGGGYLVVPDWNCVEILDAHSAQTTSVIPIKEFQPAKVAVSANGKGLALVRHGSTQIKGHGTGALFEKSHLNEGQQPVDLVSISGLSNIKICYMADGRRLFMGARFHDMGVIVMCWAVESCRTLNHIKCGYKGSSIVGSIYPIGWGETSGVILRLDDQRPDKDYNIYTEHVSTFITFSSEGREVGRYVTDPYEVAYGVTKDKVIFLKDGRYLWTWNGRGGGQSKANG